MKRILSVAVAAASAQMAATAQAEDRTMEHVIVSVPIYKQEADSALPITVLTGDELRRVAAATIGETLGDRAGIANSSFGPAVGRPVIRGQQGPRAITLQNNILSADVSSLSPDHSVNVEPLLAESIEVLRGPSTLLYGGGAIGGVVNVIDNRIPKESIDGLQGGVEYRYDDASDMDSGVGVFEFGGGGFNFHLSGTARRTDDIDIPGYAIDEAAVEAQEELLGGHEEEEHEEEETENTDGFIANTDSELDTVTAGISFNFGKGSFFGLSVSQLDSEYGLPPGAHGHHEEHEEEHEHDEDHDEDHEDEHDEDHEDEHEDEHDEDHEDEHDHEGEEEEEFIRLDMEQTRYDALLVLQNPFEKVEAMRAFLTYTDYEHNELEGDEVGTVFTRETWEGRFELVHGALLGTQGVIGLQGRLDEFAAVGEEGYVPETDSEELGLFIIEDFQSGDVLYELGARVDLVERDPDTAFASKKDFTSFSLSGSGLWQLSEDWQVGLSASWSERAPASEELFSNVEALGGEELVTHPATGVIEVGDPDLSEEGSLNLDLAFQWHSGRSWAELSVFYNDFQDYIFLLNTGEEEDETPIYAYEQEDAEFYGVEFESSFHVTDLGAGAVLVGVRGDLITGEFESAGDVPRLPPLRIGGRLSWVGENFSTWVSVLNADDQEDPGNFETETDGYTRWDLGANYDFQIMEDAQASLFVKWKNFTDEEIRLSTSFLRNYAPEAGESIEAGIRVTF